MQIYFSPKELGFFFEGVHDISKTDPLIKISSEEYTKLMQGQEAGKSVQADKNGNPVLVNSPQRAAISQVSKAQAKYVLLQRGLWQPLLDQVASIEDSVERQTAEIAIHDTTMWRRDSPTLNRIAPKIGLSEADLDALFFDAFNVRL